MLKCSEMLNDAKLLVSKMTLEEKAGLCSGKNFWNTKGVARLGLPSIMVTDGPHGLRKQAGESDNLGINESVPATCFPTAVTSASGFDVKLMEQMGVAIAEECIENGVSVVLGPGVNIKRNPLCGRNFEYISEDPLVAGVLASALTHGVQSKNIGVSVKHYLANSQERARMSSDSVIDERALREIYLSAFERIIKTEQPATLMCAYNKINGVYASDNKRFMSDIPRNEWGFKGLIMTDWGAMNDRIKAVEAGLDLEMPSSSGENDRKIVAAVKSGALDEKLLDICAANVTALILATKDNKVEKFSREAHNDLARRIARESAVLLKNDGILPIQHDAKILIVGEFAKVPRYQGAGSSKINPTSITSLTDELDKKGIKYTYQQGYESASNKANDKLISAAVAAAKNADIVVCMVGLPDSFESEGFDRTHMDMPISHNKLVQAIANVNKNTIAVLYVGSPVVIPWRNDVKGILNMYLGGQNVGGATYDLLFGDFSPCGKLAETFPLSLADTPNNKWFATGEKVVPYAESIFVGYRYYDTANVSVQFPFGFGLSYTSFEYSNLKVTNDGKTVSVDVKNTGTFEGKEIVQLYVSAPKTALYKPNKELKGFVKVNLQVGETKTVTMNLDIRSYSYFNTESNNWQVEGGTYQIQIGASIADIRLKQDVQIVGDGVAIDFVKSASSYLDVTSGFNTTDFETILGHALPVVSVGKPYHLSSTVGDIRHTLIGKMICRIAAIVVKKMFGKDKSMLKMGEAMILEMPLRVLGMMSGGIVSMNMVEGIVKIINGHFFKGLKQVLSKKGKSKKFA